MPEPTPMSARSVILSLMLGAHPRGMTPQSLAQAGDHVGIASATVRVALTRAVASHDLQRIGSTYHLGDRLLARRRSQEDHAAVVPWDGTWETVVVVGAGRPSSQRAALRTTLAAARLAELREGVWLRPANLGRPTPTSDAPDLRAFRSSTDDDPSALVAMLWDLPTWADEALEILETFESTSEPAPRLAVAAHLVRHLATDPLLPAELCPAWWPAQRAWVAYDVYQQELQEIAHR